MRLGVLDVGSNTVHLLVVDAHQGARPVPAFSHKGELRLGDHLDAENRLSQDCALQLRDFVGDALRIAEDQGVLDDVDFVIGTFSKSVGTVGGFCVSNHPKFEILRLVCRPYVFTASLPPSLKQLSTLRNPAAHSESVSSDDARKVRDRILGVGGAGLLMELGRVRVQ